MLSLVVRGMLDGMSQGLSFIFIAFLFGFLIFTIANRKNIAFTIQNWENDVSKCPDYVSRLLERAVMEDYENRR